MVASAADVLPRVERLIAGEDVAGLGDRRVPLEGGQTDHDSTPRNVAHAGIFVINELSGTNLALRWKV